ncbi:MAG: carboxylating nicotinate-nucleotide diphosphorylase [Deltaproteobacteria bacterium]|nr:carboxylating nicotinate-nucleotide diphosphorylase [Deltaproteobacteria bacterium]MDL1961849.1 carboxylating nicotinate-nucleotide diphosphorylase [Deltaproteobacteria bacterium]
MASHIYPPPRFLYSQQISAALAEDLEHGDITTDAIVPPETLGSAVIVAKESAVVAGTFVAQEVFRQMDPDIQFKEIMEEGSEVSRGDVVIRLNGKLAAILQTERVALNFLQRMCGIATLTRRFVQELSGLPCRLVDTRKTTPGMRLLQKYAVRIGGGHNHRYGLSDGILIKDNHIMACGSIKESITRARVKAPHTLLLEIEVSGIEELEEAIEGGADAVLLDNMDAARLREAVSLARRLKPRIILEASGGIRLENVREIGETGVDIISVGLLTHSAKASDLSLRVLK